MLRYQTIISRGLILLLFLPGALAGANENAHYDRINLSVSAQQEVANDTLIVVLSAREEGEELPALSDTVNRTIKQAVKKSKQVPGVEVRTLAYQTNPRYQKQRLIGWQVRQAIQLESRDIDALSRLLGELQTDLAVESMGYAVSAPRREALEQTLINQAIERFKQRAGDVTRQLDRKQYRLVNMHIQTEGQPPRPMAMRDMAVMQESKVAAPQVEPGTQTLRVTLNATIELVVK